MATGDPESNRGTRARAGSKPDSVGKRVIEWFWLGKLAEKWRALPKPGARLLALTQRAQVCAALAQNTADVARRAEFSRSAMTSAQPPETSAEANASELARQSAYWALCALASRSDERAGTSYDETIWDTLDEQLLLLAAGQYGVSPLRDSLRRGSFVFFAELPPAERLALSIQLQKLSELLLAKLNERSIGLKALFWQRSRRLSLLLWLALALAGTAVWEKEADDLHYDLAQGKPWVASSKAEAGCVSPAQSCPESPQFFFHTREEKDPTVTFDLGLAQSISTVLVENRRDCCQERALPLIVEVSEDDQHWQKVAQQDASFTNFRAAFTPVKARWVRLRAQKVTYLHLARVRILP